jgi:DNA-binding response OmpR family regulator
MKSAGRKKVSGAATQKSIEIAKENALSTSQENRTKSVLIVDDEPHIVNLVKLSLNNGRYSVTGAYSAREALSMLDTNNPDVILVDLMMPGINGYELCNALRAHSKTKQTPIIILSAKGQISDKIHAIDVGADDYITKPFDPMELERRIRLNLTGTGNSS